jgi:hypothetical protein
MAKKRKNAQTTKRGKVRKLIPPLFGQPEKAEIVVHDADDLFREVRIENKLEDAEGNKVKLKQNAEVDVTVEADEKDTTPTSA